jgi:hypothetical protein
MMTFIANAALALAFVVICVAFLIRKILWMRLLLLTATLLALVFCYASPERAAMLHEHTAVWLWLLVGVQGVRLVTALRERQSLRWSTEEMELRSTVFKGMTARSFNKLMRAGRWRTLKPESLIVVEDREVKQVALVYHGHAVVQVQGKTVARVKHGSFVGEMALLAGGVASATVKAVESVRCVMWNTDDLRDLMNRDRDLEAALHEVFSADLIEKLGTAPSPTTRLPKHRTSQSPFGEEEVE